jgi:rhamnosyltransferase
VTEHRVGAVVVMFQPDLDVLENIRALMAQVDALVVVDNGSSPDFRTALKPLQDRANLVLMINPENLGIGQAFNAGAKLLIAQGCDFVLTFDQDSYISDGFVDAMLDAFKEAQARFGDVGVLAPHWHDRHSGITYPNLGPGRSEMLPILTTISSGNLIPVTTFSRVGFLKEPYFIDGVDIEYHLRCLQYGLRVVQTPAAVLEHSLGRQSTRHILGITIIETVHNHLRRYYIARNRIQNYRRYFRLVPGFVLSDFLNFIGDMLSIALFDADRGRKLRFTWLGIRDGLRGKMGRCEYD